MNMASLLSSTGSTTLHLEAGHPLNAADLDIKAAFDSIDRTVVWKASVFDVVKLKFHWDQFPRNFLADLLATSPTSP